MTEPWEPEQIPDEDELYMRVHANQIQDGRPELGVFRNRTNLVDPAAPKAMSTDWCKFSTPEETRARSLRSAPEENGVISLNVGGVRALYMQRVEHSPWYQDPEDPRNPNNRAHTDVLGPKSSKEATDPDERIDVLTVRVGMLEMCRWEILPPGISTA